MDGIELCLPKVGLGLELPPLKCGLELTTLTFCCTQSPSALQLQEALPRVDRE